jgi:integrase
LCTRTYEKLSEPLKLKKSDVECLPVPPRGYTLHWDGQLKGFGVRVTARGVKTFVLQRRVNGKERRITIGRFGPLTAEQARREATRLLGAIASGRDPVAERKQAELAAVTLGETFTEYLSVRCDLRPNTVKGYQRVMGISFGDWRKRPLVEITGDMVGKRHAVLGERYGKAWANLSMRVLRALFNFAAANYEVGGKALVLDNPVKRLSRTRAWFRIDRRETLIKPHQLRPWMDAVLGLDNGLARDYLQLVLLTGLRRSEALGLQWEDVDLLGRTLTVKDTKRTTATIPCPSRTASRPSCGACRGTAPTSSRARGRLNNLSSALEEVARRSGVSFCIHDLRRTFATIADSLDIPGYAVKALLNHKGGSDVTAGYVVASVDRLREPMQNITDYVLRCAGVELSAEVLPFERADRPFREVSR